MKSSTKVVKERIEEAAGALTDNDTLRAKGQTDQAVGHVKQAQERIYSMRAKKTMLAGLLVPFMLAGCLMVPGPRGGGVALVPLLPPIVVLGAEPYYVHEGYYYYYRNDGWSYSRSRRGPWVDLPRDHYPREVRFRDGGPERGGGRNPGHQGR